MIRVKQGFIILCVSLLTACGGMSAQKPDSQSTSSKTQPGKGGYYLDDGPGDNAPADIDSIPDATPKTENLLARANRPYSALGQNYTPMTRFEPYIKQGIASWYGKRYHGKKTSSGEVYDMYAMSGAHTTLPIPSYVRVTNPANGRSVIVRINDRGPFKHSRLIDLSYAAAYKLRIIAQGSALVEVEAINTSVEALQKNVQTSAAENIATLVPPSIAPEQVTPTAPITTPATTGDAKPAELLDVNKSSSAHGYYVQVGAFKSESNGDLLQKKVQSLNLADNATATNVYNNGLYRVKLGPFNSKQEADAAAYKVQQQLNISTIVTNQ